MAFERSLSALEATALGIILKRGPCLAHTLVVQFADSHTFAYRSGAGSIYPLLKRLTQAGLLRVDARRYALTEPGLRALRAWILSAHAEGEIGTTLDVLRSRVYFLKLLGAEELGEFCKGAISSLERLLEECRTGLADQRDSGDAFGELAMLGAVYETEARIEWMKEVARRVRAQSSDRAATSASGAKPTEAES